MCLIYQFLRYLNQEKYLKRQTIHQFNYFAVECLNDWSIYHTLKQETQSKFGSYLNLFLSSRSILCNLSSLSWRRRSLSAAKDSWCCRKDDVRRPPKAGLQKRKIRFLSVTFIDYTGKKWVAIMKQVT